ncbi:MAG: hypothetical protein CVU56_09570 [Deltaproteobacteria bacterium HGW-Deltaproteobacteria-14]|nr:MAG: hypothetical protein CVU56_09570 [Deltaproteobacteria bacterium HGW-Deltaproteobacteria-14]
MGKHKSGEKKSGKTKASKGAKGREVEAEAEGNENAPVEQVADPNAKVAKLHLMVDLESRHVGYKEMAAGDVGHTWVSIEWDDANAVPDTVPGSHAGLLQSGGKYADPMGFWPDLEGLHTKTGEGVGYSKNPLMSYVQGHMRHPDRGHEGSEKATMTWAITEKEALKAMRYADKKAAAQYSVYFYNCTTFAKEVAGAAGKSAPNMSKGGICLPDAAYDGILKAQTKGKDAEATYDVKGQDEGRSEDFVNQADLLVTFEQQFLGERFTQLTGKPCGLMVTEVRQGSPAQGVLNAGDVVVYIEGQRSNSTATLRRALFGKIGQEIEVTVLNRARLKYLNEHQFADGQFEAICRDEDRAINMVEQMSEDRDITAVAAPPKGKPKAKGGKSGKAKAA